MARLKKEKRQREYEEFRKTHPDAPDPIRAEELESTKDRTVINRYDDSAALPTTHCFKFSRRALLIVYVNWMWMERFAC
jgi:hypothetical protein